MLSGWEDKSRSGVALAMVTLTDSVVYPPPPGLVINTVLTADTGRCISVAGWCCSRYFQKICQHCGNAGGLSKTLLTTVKSHIGTENNTVVTSDLVIAAISHLVITVTFEGLYHDSHKP